jgi:hypothetical protein
MLLRAPCNAIAFSEITKEFRSLDSSPTLGAARARAHSAREREVDFEKRMVAIVPDDEPGKAAVERHLFKSEQRELYMACLQGKQVSYLA